jgi:hypothetical protein
MPPAAKAAFEHPVGAKYARPAQGRKTFPRPRHRVGGRRGHRQLVSDTPPVLAKWGARFGADTNRWRLLTGEKTVLHGLIAKVFWRRTTVREKTWLATVFVKPL